MKNYYVLLFTLAFGCFYAQSPITLSNNQMPGANDTLRYTNVQINSIGNYTQTGANFNWDFSNVVSTSSGRRDFKSSFNTPYAFYFLSLNEYGEKIADTLVGGTGTVSITNYYNFYKKQTSPVNAFVADGVGMSISGLPVASYYSDKDEMYIFPLTYPKFDSTSFKFSTLTTTLLPIKYSKAGYRSTRVDGWGTVKTPYGTDNCLRVVTTQYSIDTISISLPIPGFPPFKIGTPNYQRSYQWLTTGSKIPFMEVSGNLINNNFTITQVRYRGYDVSKLPPPNPVNIEELKDISAIQSYPNPVQDKLFFMGTLTNEVKVELYSINGQFIKELAIDEKEPISFIHVEELTSGLYVVKVKQDEHVHYFKFIKQ